MTQYRGWAVEKQGKFVNDAGGAVGPALFATRREAQAWWSARKTAGEPGGVVRVTVTVKAQK